MGRQTLIGHPVLLLIDLDYPRDYFGIHQTMIGLTCQFTDWTLVLAQSDKNALLLHEFQRSKSTVALGGIAPLGHLIQSHSQHNPRKRMRPIVKHQVVKLLR